MVNDKTLQYAKSNSTIRTVINFLELVDLKVTKTTIRNKLSSLSNFPDLTLLDIVNAFEEWKIPNMAFRSNSEFLTEIPFPVIAHLKHNHLYSIGEGTFVVLVNFDGQEVMLIHPFLGTLKMPIEDFTKRWAGILLAIDPDELSGEENFIKASQEEDAMINSYRNSIKLIDNFLSNIECDYLIDYCNLKGFERSKVGLSGEITIDRSSSSAIITDKKDSIVNGIYLKASHTINLPIDFMENLQCIKYSAGQEFKTHYDADKDFLRTHTLLFYLNDDYEGGGTFFPEIDFVVKPKRGSCLLFLNLDNNLDVLPHSSHSGMPVHSGIKYICNLWVRNKPL